MPRRRSDFPPATIDLGPAVLRIYRHPLALPSQRWRWTLRANNGRTVAASTEGYGSRRAATDNFDDLTTGRYGTLPR